MRVQGKHAAARGPDGDERVGAPLPSVRWRQKCLGAAMSWRRYSFSKVPPLRVLSAHDSPPFFSSDMCDGAIKLAETPFARC